MKISARDQGDQAKACFTNLKRELKERFGCSSVYRWSPNFVTFVCQGREENVKSAIKFLQQQSQVGVDVCITDLFPYLNVVLRKRQCTLHALQTGGWALLRVFPRPTPKERPPLFTHIIYTQQQARMCKSPPSTSTCNVLVISLLTTSS